MSSDNILKLSLEPTNYCNRGCAHCGPDCSTKGFNRINLEGLGKFLLSLKESNVCTVLSIGGAGEILTYPHTQELFVTLKNKNILAPINIITSGFLPSDEIERERFSWALNELENKVAYCLSFNLFNPSATERLEATLKTLLNKQGYDQEIHIKLCYSLTNLCQTRNELGRILCEISDSHPEFVFADYAVFEENDSDFAKMIRSGFFEEKIFGQYGHDWMLLEALSLPQSIVFSSSSWGKKRVLIDPQGLSFNGRGANLKKTHLSSGRRRCAEMLDTKKSHKNLNLGELHLASDNHFYPCCDCSGRESLRIGRLGEKLEDILEKRDFLKRTLLQKVLTNKTLLPDICSICEKASWEMS